MTQLTLSRKTFPSLLAFAALLLAGCSPAASDAPLRSPTRDYPPPPTTTADGEVLGADGVDPADRLGEGVRVGSDNELAPGWKPEEGNLKHNPKERTGGATDGRVEQEPGSGTPITPK